MKDTERIEILLKVIERVYSKNSGIQTLIDESIIDKCKEGLSFKQVFFAFLCCWLYRYELSEHNFSVCEGQPIFSGDQEKKTCRIFCRWNFKGATQGSPDFSGTFEGKAKLKLLFFKYVFNFFV